MARRVLIEGLGKCEHCGAILSIEGLPTEAMDAIWKCPKCEKELTGKSFGYEEAGKSNFEKVRWVGERRRWVRKKPSEDFNLGNWRIIIAPPRLFINILKPKRRCGKLNADM